jgi:serine/threonine protein kinase
MHGGLNETHPLGSSFRPGIVVGGKFTLLRLIAQGGYGAVYEAEDNLIHRRVALKLLHPQVAAIPDVVRRFLREAQALAKIDHPNVVSVLEMGQRRDGSYFIVQELLCGGNLREQLSDKPQLSPHEAVDILTPIMGALMAAHRRGIIHRDLKPENIVLARTSSGELVPKLVDFGVAKMPRTGNWGASTVLGHMLGTPHYMAPEQIAQSSAIDWPADVWAMGIVLFEILAGRCPFEGDPAQVLIAVQTQPMPRIESFVPSLAPDLAGIVHQALQADPERRPSMQSLREQLLAWSARQARLANTATDFAKPARAFGELTETELQTLEPDAELIEAEPEELIEPEPEEVPLSSRDFMAAEDAPPPRVPTSAPRVVAGVTRTPGRLDMGWADEPMLPDQPAAKKLVIEAEHALRVNALDDAIVYAERAFASAKGARELCGRARLVQAIACSWLGGHADAERSAAEALQGFPRAGLAWYTALGHLALAGGQLGKRRELLDISTELRDIEAAGPVEDAHLVAACRLVVSLVRVGSADAAQDVLARTLRRAAKLAASEPFARAWLAVARAALAAHSGDPMLYLAQITASVDAFTEAGDVRSACLQRVNIGNAYLQLGGYGQAEAVLRDALTVAEPMGLGFVPGLRANLGFSFARQRKLEQAAAMEAEALDLCIRQGDRRFECVARIYLAIIRALEDDVAAAMERAKEAIAASGDFPAIQAYAEATLAGFLLIQSQAGPAMRVAEDAMALLDKLSGVEEGEALIRVVYASALHATGSRQKALASIGEARSRLLARAARIREPRFRRSFLENVPENARTMRLAASWAKGESDLLI